MPFSHMRHYFRFKYTPLVSSIILYEKRFIYVPLASRSFGESVSKSTLYPIFTFSHIMHMLTVPFYMGSLFPFLRYTFPETSRKLKGMLYEKGFHLRHQLSLRGKCIGETEVMTHYVKMTCQQCIISEKVKMGYKVLLETLSPKLLDAKGDVNKPLFIKHS